MVRVITVVKMLWTHEAQPSESATILQYKKITTTTITNITKEISVKISLTRTWKCTCYIMQMSYLLRVRLSCQKILQTHTTCRNNVREKSNDEYSFSIRVQTTINHIRFVFYHNNKDNERNLSRFCWLGLESACTTSCKWAPCTHQRIRLSCQELLQTRSTCRNNAKKMLRKQATIKHISICFFTAIWTSK